MKYSTRLGDQICDAVAHSTIGLRHICEQLNVPYSTATSWIYDPQHEMYNKYIHAKQMQLGHIADEIFEILDDSRNDYMEVVHKGKTKTIQNKETMARTRLRVQTRMNILTKLAPILYGVKPEKTTHKVIMPEPPGSATESRPQEEAKTATKKKTAKAAPLPKTSFAPAKALAVAKVVADEADKPKTTFKYFEDGTYEEYNEQGKLICKSMPSYNPKPHYQGFW